MNKSILTRARIILPALLCIFGANASAQTLTSRFTFEGGSALDTVGNFDSGSFSTNQTNLVAPVFTTSQLPGGSLSAMQVGMSFGTKKSFFTTNHAAVNFSQGSISFYAYTTALPTGGESAYPLSTGTLDNGVHVLLNSAGQIRARVGDTSSELTTVDLNKWVHHTVAWDNTTGNATYYLSDTAGQQLASVGFTFTAGTYAPSAALRLGGFSQANDDKNFANQHRGSFYDFQVHNGVLSSAQVASLAANPGLTLSQIPEPSSYAVLAGAACLMLVAVRRRGRSLA